MKCSLAALYFIIANVAVLLQLGSGRRLRPEKNGRFRGTPAEPKQALLAEMEEALGSEHRKMAEKQVKEFEKELEHTFKALPKNARGALTAPSVRYALHRLFNQRYGWQIKGLETGGGAWDSDSPVVAMGDRVPSEMRELFEHRLGNYGLSLHELAVLAATMDNMFRTDVAARLQIVYEAYSMEKDGELDRHNAMNAMIAYISSFIIGSRVEQLTPAEVISNVQKLPRVFSRTEAAKQLLNDIITEVASDKDSFDLDTITSILSVFGQKLGALEDRECKVMKEKLIAREERVGNGRVRLGDFYKDDSEGLVHFTESVEYMRAHGMLDESSPADPKVIIPNYLAGPSNCVSPSGHYEICCFDDCESLMDKIEGHIGAPMATPETIAAYVSSLASASQPANRTLPAGLLRLLEDVAAHHDGQVPIHGRLFSQWMHQAYPRECNHPHAISQNRFQRTDLKARATAAEKQLHMEQAHQSKLEVAGIAGEAEFTTAGLWTMHEELVDAKALDMHRAKSSRLHDFCALGVAGFVGMLLVKMLLGDKIRQTKKSKLL